MTRDDMTCCRYGLDRHLTKEWSEVTREIPDISTAAARAATYVTRLKVGLSLSETE